MKLGLVSAILDKLSFEEMIDFVSEVGLECVEVACWPKGDAERRYAGVSHIDVTTLGQERVDYILRYCAQKGVEISALAFYPNVLDPDQKKREANIAHLYQVIEAAAALRVGLVTTFLGRDPRLSVEENLPLVTETWTPLLRYAEERNVRIAIENCPMLFTYDEWPGGKNLMTTPSNWRRIFALLNSPNLGIAYDPSHFIWQQIDYIKPLYEFRDKIFHVHYKDIKLYPEKLKDVGIMAAPLEYMSPKLPGLGDVDWGRYVSALTDIGYSGATCIEVEDKAFEQSEDCVKKAILLSIRYLKNFVI